MSFPRNILTAEELQCLEDDGIVIPLQSLHETGKRKISVSLISSPSTISAESPSSALVGTVNFKPGTISTEIPLVEESPAVLEYIGFETTTANEIYDRFVGRPYPEICPNSPLEYAYGQVEQLDLPRHADLDIDEAMRRVGLEEAIADPAFTDLLNTESLIFWIKDTIEKKITQLCQRLLKRHAGRRLSKKKGASLEGVFEQPVAPTVTVNMTPEDFDLPAAHVAILGSDPPALPDHVTLFKGNDS